VYGKYFHPASVEKVILSSDTIHYRHKNKGFFICRGNNNENFLQPKTLVDSQVGLGNAG
jgi:hypothetical protein